MEGYILLRIIDKIIEYKKIILILLLGLAFLSAVAMSFVKINYNLIDYLPKDVPSTIAIDVVDNNFSEKIPNLNVYIPDVSIPEAISNKERLASISGVHSVLWLDDLMDVYQPLDILDKNTVEDWYKNGGALYSLAADTKNCVAIIEDIRSIYGEKAILSGELLNQATIQALTTGEVSQILFYVIPLVLIILLLSTGSWFEPILFLITIGVAILINEGTNLFIGEVSYVTQSTSAVLQLAVSMDYAVFLLHSFSKYRNEKNTVEAAMKKAMSESASAIAASATTTVFGFLALTFMKFELGPNMGLVLSKGILFSFLSVLLLLPILAIYTTKLMDKTRHRSFLPSFERFSKFVMRICIPLCIVLILFIVPSFLAQKNNSFIYGSSGIHSEDSQLKIDADYINSIFGVKQQMVLLFPKGNVVKEEALAKAIKDIPHITSVIAYPLTVGTEIPPEFLSNEQISQFRSDKYSRIIFYAETEEEGDEAFTLVETIRNTAAIYYGDNYHLLGQNVINYDLKDTIVKDTPFVNGAAVIAIGIVLLITFRSITLPFILLLTIEGAVWINLGIPYFTGTSLNYIGFLIISSVQLGATVDYGILFTKHYMRNRKNVPKREAARLAITNTTASILTPAGILAISCFILSIVSSNGIISELGMMLGRGAIISSLMVLYFLPALLIIFDKVILKTTIHRF